MTRHAYKSIRFGKDKRELIAKCNAIIDDMIRQGYTLSVRQLYYQLVAAAIVPNTIQSYKRVADILNDARMAGLTRWDAIEDRTRSFVERYRWECPRDSVQWAHDGYHMDMWENQEDRVFVIVEKEALVGVLDPACRKYDVPLLAARGYPSSSVMREFAVERVTPALERGQNVIVLHLGDHDPSGIDMTRDLEDKINLFAEVGSGYFDGYFKVERIALTMDQIDDQRPPPNPAKTTDSRYAGYRDVYGDSSWELDALRPQFIDNLVSTHIESYRDPHAWDARAAYVRGLRDKIKALIPMVPGVNDLPDMEEL